MTTWDAGRREARERYADVQKLRKAVVSFLSTWPADRCANPRDFAVNHAAVALLAACEGMSAAFESDEGAIVICDPVAPRFGKLRGWRWRRTTQRQAIAAYERQRGGAAWSPADLHRWLATTYGEAAPTYGSVYSMARAMEKDGEIAITSKKGVIGRLYSATPELFSRMSADIRRGVK